MIALLDRQHKAADFHHSYEPGGYGVDSVGRFHAAGERQKAKDRVLFGRLIPLFRPGRTLELGAGSGHVARLLVDIGRTVDVSDFSVHMVDHLRGADFPDAQQLDATNLPAELAGRYTNMVAVSISPFITSDEATIFSTYCSTLRTVVPGGRLFMIHAMAKRSQLDAVRSRHRAIAEHAGWIVKEFRRDQVLPSAAYRRLPTTVTTLVERLLASTLGSRLVLVAEAP
jgi:SAM-dependent methyltransferase